MKSLILSLKYIRYFFSASTSHDIHSPFIFNLVTKAIHGPDDKDAFRNLERIRLEMLGNHSKIQIRDYGAGFGGKKFTEREISFIAAHSSKSKKYCRLLFRIVKFLSPATMVELGTSVGMSAMYQASAAPYAQMTTLEGCENTAELAKMNFQKAGLPNIRVVTGNFEETLPGILNGLVSLDYVFIDGNHQRDAVLQYFFLCIGKVHQHSCFIIDDINWSEGMQQAWNTIREHPAVYVTVDLFMVGLVFFNSDMSRQHFTVRY